jgi:hypothetical protein
MQLNPLFSTNFYTYGLNAVCSIVLFADTLCAQNFFFVDKNVEMRFFGMLPNEDAQKFG